MTTGRGGMPSSLKSYEYPPELDDESRSADDLDCPLWRLIVGCLAKEADADADAAALIDEWIAIDTEEGNPLPDPDEYDDAVDLLAHLLTESDHSP